MVKSSGQRDTTGSRYIFKKELAKDSAKWKAFNEQLS